MFGRVLRIGAAVILALLLVGLGGVVAGGSCVFRKLGGDFAGRPEDAPKKLSRKAKTLVKRAVKEFDGQVLADYHVHAVALGTHVTGAYVHEDMTSMSSPTRYIQYLIYMSAAGVDDEAQADTQYLERLVDLAQHLPVKIRHRLLAFDQHYRPDGTVDKDKTEFYTPNEYVFEVARHHRDLFEPVMSVHPYRPDALEALERWSKEGGRMVKWLPNAMGIDPLDPALAGYYAKMKALGLVLLTHAGEEKAVESEEDQELGNPLRLRGPLDAGVRVLVAHCASLGQSKDLDAEGEPLADNFELWLRLMDEPRYQGLVFGEISAVAQFNRVGRPLQILLEREDLHGRLVNGSDYPLPAINALIHTSDFVGAGYITEDEREALNELYRYNPLLFDLVLKRTLRRPGTDRGFPVSMFLAHPDLER